MTKLCPRGKAAAKRKFDVYPSAYANAYASKICAGKIKDPSGKKRKDFKGPKPMKRGGSVSQMAQKESRMNAKKLQKALKDYKKLIKKPMKNGGFVAKGCGAIMSNRKKKTRFV
jgi:hypothetical protein